MRFEQTIDIAAPTDIVWSVMSDLARWPEWTGTVKSLQWVERDLLAEGAKARVAIDGAPTGVWTISEVDEGQSFTWENHARGVHSVAGHVIQPQAGGSHVTLWIEQTGFIASLLKPYISRVSKRNLPIEAAGLKRTSEARVTTPLDS